MATTVTNTVWERENINTLEKGKFAEDSNGDVVVRAKLTDTSTVQELDGLNNTIDYVKTTVGTTATLLEFPENSNEFVLFHESASTLYLAKESTVSSSDIPIYANDVLEMKLIDDDCNEIYALSSSGNISVFIMGVARE